MTDIRVMDLDPADADAVDAWNDVLNRSISATVPGFPAGSLTGLVVGMARPMRHYRTAWLIAHVDGRPAGIARLAGPLRENTDNVTVEIEVDPKLRRRGVGTALLAAVEKWSLDQGRHTLHVYLCGELPGEPPMGEPGKAFAARNGFENKQYEVRRRVDLDTVDESSLDALLADAWTRADGYELVRWLNRVPERYVADVAYLDGRLVADAPTGDLVLEPDDMDAERVRDREQWRAACGQLDLNVGMVHRASGSLVAWTDIVVDAGGETDARQGITLVDPAHRGHRLGTIVKIVNQRWLREYRPRMRYVHTWNAEANHAMIAINEAIGYRAAERWMCHEKKLS